MEKVKTLETTIGDLIVALTEEASPFIHDEKDIYKVVAFMLTHLLINPNATFKSCQYWH